MEYFYCKTISLILQILHMEILHPIRPPTVNTAKFDRLDLFGSPCRLSKFLYWRYGWFTVNILQTFNLRKVPQLKLIQNMLRWLDSLATQCHWRSFRPSCHSSLKVWKFKSTLGLVILNNLQRMSIFGYLSHVPTWLTFYLFCLKLEANLGPPYRYEIYPQE